MSITEILEKISSLKIQIKANPNDDEIRKKLSETKFLLDNKIAEESSEKIIAAFEDWLNKHPDDKHLEIKLKKLMEQN